MGSELVKRLAQCELVIERNVNGFLEFGNALAEIKRDKLWRESGYESFEDYCQQRWSFRLNYANKVIAAAETGKEIGTRVPKGTNLPVNEKQLRPLTKLEPQEKAEAWVAAVADAGGEQPKMEQVAAAVEKVVSRQSESKPDGRPNDPKDKLDNPIPKHLQPVFSNGRFADIDRFFSSIRDTLKALINEPAGFHVNSHLVSTDRYMVKGFDEIRTELLDDGKPYAVCVGCNGSGKVRIDACKSCKGCGWLTKYKWKQIKSTTEGEALIK